MIDLDFDKAGQKAVVIGAAYDFSKLITDGLRGNVNFVWGWDAINPSTRAKAPNQTEYDFDVDYRPALTGAILQGIWFRFRSAVVDQQDAKRIGYQFRIIINWDRDLI